MKTETRQEILWHVKNALTKKFILLPFIAPCYVALFVLNYLGYYIGDFFDTVKQKTTDERQVYLEKLQEKKTAIDSRAIFAFYALTMTFLYWFVFGFSKDLNGLEVLNFPTYFLTALPIEAFHQLSILPVHYMK